MTSTNDGKDVKSNQASGTKGKTYYIELYKSLEARLSEGGDASERTKHLCEAWRWVHSLCQHSAPSTHTHLLSWLQRHTARTVLQTEWQTPKREGDRQSLEDAIDSFIAESEGAKALRNGSSTAWELQLVARGQWFKRMLARPWDHPVLTLLLNPNGTPPTDDEVLKWLTEERGVTFVMRLHTLVGEKCEDIAMSLANAVMERVRAGNTPVSDAEDAKDVPLPDNPEPTFGDRLKEEAGFTPDVWEMLTDIEFVLLHKRDSKRCIALAKQTPLLSAYHLIERLQKRLEISPREKRLWKNAKEVAILIAQVVIARCMMVSACVGPARTALYCCARLLARLLGSRLPAAADALANQAPTARHLHTLAVAVDKQLSPTDESVKPYICELYVRAITAGMNELERLKLKTEKEAEARSMEKTLASWFVQLGEVLSRSDRIMCECTLTAFSLHPSQKMYERLDAAPQPAPVVADTDESKEETVKSEFGSWANDSRSQTNFVKTSETLNMKHTQNQANVLSTAIFNEGEALGLSPELCQDIAVLLSGPRVKTLSWDMDRTLLLENCRAYSEQTHGGTRVLTRELKYLNIDPTHYQHLPEERDDDENDPYYGIERGYEHLVPEDPEEIWEDANDPDRTETASSSIEDDFITPRRKKKNKKIPLSSDEDSDPLSFMAEAKRVQKKKERPHSKERSKERAKKKQEPVDPLDIEGHDTQDQNLQKHKPKQKKERKERKKKEKAPKVKANRNSLSSLVGVTVIENKEKSVKVTTKVVTPVTDSDYDSQGKFSLTSMNSEGNDQDGTESFLSLDELKSSERKKPYGEGNMGLMKNHEFQITDGQVGVKISSHSFQGPDNQTRSPYKPQNQKIYRNQSPAGYNRNFSPNVQNYPEDVRENITRLLEIRRQRAAMEQLKQKNTPHTPQRHPAILRQDIPIQTNVTPKSVTIPEIPKSYIKKEHAEKLAELKREVDKMLAQRKDKKVISNDTVIQYASKCDEIKAVKASVNAFGSRSGVQQSNTNSLKMTDFVNVPYDRLMAEIAERHDRGNSEETKPPHTQSQFQPGQLQRSLSVLTPGQRDYQNFIKEYEQSKYVASGCAIDMSARRLSKDVKKEIMPVSRVVPVLPSTIRKPGPRTLQCAKQATQLKKPENPLNTFSRLSYMHKNKQTEIKNRNSTQKPIFCNSTYQEVSSELDEIIKEHQLAQMRVIQAKNEKLDRTLTKPVSTNNQELKKNSEPNGAKNHPLLTNLLQNKPKSISNTFLCQTESQVQNNHFQQKPVSPPKTSLSDKDQNDLLNLLRQQNRLNVLGSTNTNSKPSTSKTDNKAISNNVSPMAHYNLTSGQRLGKPASHVNDSCQSSLETKIINIISNTLIKQQTNNADNHNIVKTSPVVSSGPKSVKAPDSQDSTKNNTNKSNATRNQAKSIPESEKPEWQAVMSDLLKHRTPTRGPNALDVALNKSSFELAFEKSLNEPPVFTPKPSTSENSFDPVKRQGKDPPKTATALAHNVIITKNKGIKIQAEIPKKQKTDLKKYSSIKKPVISGNDKNIKQNASEVAKKLPCDVQRKQFTYAVPKHDDPFISGIPNSDYDLLEELMDDDLRKEIGELSSDDESYNAAAQSFLRPTKTNEKRVCVEFNKPIGDVAVKKLGTDMRSLNPRQPARDTMQPAIQNPIIQCANKMAQEARERDSINVSQGSEKAAKNKIQDSTCLLTLTSQSAPAHITTNSNTQNQTCSNVKTLANNHDLNIYSSGKSKQAPLQNVMLIGSELVYERYVPTPVHSVSNIASSGYVAVNKAPNLALYQTTEFAASVVNPLIIGSSMNVPVISTVPCATISVQPCVVNNVSQLARPATTAEVQTQASNSHKDIEGIYSKAEFCDSVPVIDIPLQSNKPLDENKAAKTKIDASYTKAKFSDSKPVTDSSLQYNKPLDANKAGERKVLSEVQKMAVFEKVDKTQIENELNIKKDVSAGNEDRLKKKRLAIINREINHRCGEEPIALAYTPLPLKTITVSNKHVISEAIPLTYTPLKTKKEEKTSECEEEKLLTQIKNNLQDLSDSINDIQSPATPDSNESKENKSIPIVPCRRILLRSSNKITVKSNVESVDTGSLNSKNTKIKLKSEMPAVVKVRDKSSRIVADNKEESAPKRASKRLRNKILTKEEKTQSKSQQHNPNYGANLPLKNKVKNVTKAKTEKSSLSSTNNDVAFDIETELLSSKISKSNLMNRQSEKRPIESRDEISMPAVEEEKYINPENSISHDLIVNPFDKNINNKIISTKPKQADDVLQDLYSNVVLMKVSNKPAPEDLEIDSKILPVAIEVKDATPTVSLPQKIKCVTKYDVNEKIVDVIADAIVYPLNKENNDNIISTANQQADDVLKDKDTHVVIENVSDRLASNGLNVDREISAAKEEKNITTDVPEALKTENVSKHMDIIMDNIADNANVCDNFIKNSPSSNEDESSLLFNVKGFNNLQSVFETTSEIIAANNTAKESVVQQDKSSANNVNVNDKGVDDFIEKENIDLDMTVTCEEILISKPPPSFVNIKIARNKTSNTVNKNGVAIVSDEIKKTETQHCSSDGEIYGTLALASCKSTKNSKQTGLNNKVPQEAHSNFPVATNITTHADNDIVISDDSSKTVSVAHVIKNAKDVTEKKYNTEITSITNDGNETELYIENVNVVPVLASCKVTDNNEQTELNHKLPREKHSNVPIKTITPANYSEDIVVLDDDSETVSEASVIKNSTDPTQKRINTEISSIATDVNNAGHYIEKSDVEPALALRKVISNNKQIKWSHNVPRETHSNVPVTTNTTTNIGEDILILDDDSEIVTETPAIENSNDAKQKIINTESISVSTDVNHVSEVPQSFKDSIRIEHLPSDDPKKRVVRVILPNGRKFKATVHGEVNFTFDTLFSYPSIKSTLLNGMNHKKLYTMNIKQITTVANNDPSKILSAQILDIKMTSPTEPVETIDLLSDDEDKGPARVIEKNIQAFETEYGKYHISPIDKDMFTKHQKKFNRKSFVLLKKVDTKPYDNNDRKMSNNAKRFQHNILSLIPDQYVTGLMNDIENKLTSVAKSAPADIVEIDDSSNDGLEHCKFVGNIQPDKTINELKNVLLKELGVEEVQAIKNVYRKDRSRNKKRNVLKETVSTKNSSRHSGLLKLSEIPAGESCPFIDLHKEEQLKIISRKSYIPLIRCDELANVYEQNVRDSMEKSCEQVPIKVPFLPNVVDTEPFTIAEDFSFLKDLGSNKELEARSSSPVIQLSDVLVSLDTKSVTCSEAAVYHVIPVSCEANWLITKSMLHFEGVNNEVLIQPTVFNQTIMEICSTSTTSVLNETVAKYVPTQNICVPSLTSLVLKYFQNNYILHRYSLLRRAKSRPFVKLLKRKSTLLGRSAPAKVLKLEKEIIIGQKPTDCRFSSTDELDDSVTDISNDSVSIFGNTKINSDINIASDKSFETEENVHEREIENTDRLSTLANDIKCDNNLYFDVGNNDEEQTFENYGCENSKDTNSIDNNSNDDIEIVNKSETNTSDENDISEICLTSPEPMSDIDSTSEARSPSPVIEIAHLLTKNDTRDNGDIVILTSMLEPEKTSFECDVACTHNCCSLLLKANPDNINAQSLEIHTILDKQEDKHNTSEICLISQAKENANSCNDIITSSLEVKTNREDKEEMVIDADGIGEVDTIKDEQEDKIYNANEICSNPLVKKNTDNSSDIITSSLEVKTNREDKEEMVIDANGICEVDTKRDEQNDKIYNANAICSNLLVKKNTGNSNNIITSNLEVKTNREDKEEMVIDANRICEVDTIKDEQEDKIYNANEICSNPLVKKNTDNSSDIITSSLEVKTNREDKVEMVFDANEICEVDTKRDEQNDKIYNANDIITSSLEVKTNREDKEEMFIDANGICEVGTIKDEEEDKIYNANECCSNPLIKKNTDNSNDIITSSLEVKTNREDKEEMGFDANGICEVDTKRDEQEEKIYNANEISNPPVKKSADNSNEIITAKLEVVTRLEEKETVNDCDDIEMRLARIVGESLIDIKSKTLHHSVQQNCIFFKISDEIDRNGELKIENREGDTATKINKTLAADSLEDSNYNSSKEKAICSEEIQVINDILLEENPDEKFSTITGHVLINSHCVTSKSSEINETNKDTPQVTSISTHDVMSLSENEPIKEVEDIIIKTHGDGVVYDITLNKTPTKIQNTENEACDLVHHEKRISTSIAEDFSGQVDEHLKNSDILKNLEVAKTQICNLSTHHVSISSTMDDDCHSRVGEPDVKTEPVNDIVLDDKEVVFFNENAHTIMADDCSGQVKRQFCEKSVNLENMVLVENKICNLSTHHFNVSSIMDDDCHSRVEEDIDKTRINMNNTENEACDLVYHEKNVVAIISDGCFEQVEEHRKKSVNLVNLIFEKEICNLSTHHVDGSSTMDDDGHSRVEELNNMVLDDKEVLNSVFSNENVDTNIDDDFCSQEQPKTTKSFEDIVPNEKHKNGCANINDDCSDQNKKQNKTTNILEETMPEDKKTSDSTAHDKNVFTTVTNDCSSQVEELKIKSECSESMSEKGNQNESSEESVEKSDVSIEEVLDNTEKSAITFNDVSAEAIMSKYLTLIGNDSKVFEGIVEYEDPEAGTCYVIPIIETCSESDVSSHENTEALTAVIQGLVNKNEKVNDETTNIASDHKIKHPSPSTEINIHRVSDYDDIEAKLAKIVGEPLDAEEQNQYYSYKSLEIESVVSTSKVSLDDKYKTTYSVEVEVVSGPNSEEETQQSMDTNGQGYIENDMTTEAFTENLKVIMPKHTYAKATEHIGQRTKNLKRKIDMSDVKTSGKKYRKGKNIDYPKITAIAMSKSAYAGEYKRLIDYCSSVKFSFAIPFHKDDIDVHNTLKSWPIKDSFSTVAEDSPEGNVPLFTEIEKSEALLDPLKQTLSDEIISKYSENSYTPSNIDETNFNMGFGEGSGRVIQESIDGEHTTFSAATLSDVKQLQPLLPSDEPQLLVKQNNRHNQRHDELLKTKRFVDLLNLREKVRSFFTKTKDELSLDLKHKNKDGFESTTSDWPFGDLTFIQPCPIEMTVNVVQVGQLPVSAAAQNPVTCDPRVTHVSNVSPQCSPENSSNDDLQTTIKTEYTELTTANITLPLMQEYAQHHHSIPTESQEPTNLYDADDSISTSTQIKSVVKIELMEETSQETVDDNSEYSSLQQLTNGNMNNDVQYNFNKNTNNITAELDPNAQIVGNSSKKTKTAATFSDDKQHRDISDKSDQIANAMNAAGISATQVMAKPNSAASIDTIPQNSQPDIITTSQANTGNYSKSTPMNALALQQALAQILPPPLSQTNTSENNQQTSTNPQVVHIVQGNTQSVINKPNGTQLLHIVQNKSAASTNGTPTSQPNNFSGLSLVDGAIQQNGNQLLHIVNTGNQKNSNAGQLLKRVNLLTNLANVQGSNEQKMVQFVCKSADGKSIQLPHQRSMVLRLQPLDPSSVPTTQKQNEAQDLTPSSSTSYSVNDKESNPQEMKSRSLYEENYAKFVQNGDSKPSQEKATSLPKFNQVFGKQVYQDKQSEIGSGNLPENSECPPEDNVQLEQMNEINSSPMLTRKPQAQPSKTQPNLVQQIKQTIGPSNIQTMHGGVIYTRQIPVNLGNGQTINLITVPSTEMADDSAQKQKTDCKFGNQEADPPVIKIVSSNQPAATLTGSTEDNNAQMRSTNEANSQQNPQTQPQPVLTQMRIKLPMLSKAPQIVGGARVVRPAFFQIQRNVIGGANQQVYQQLVLTAAPPLGQSIRLPAQVQKPKTPSETQSSPESQMSSSTLEQLREFDMVLEQVKERSTVQPGSSTSSTSTSFTKSKTSPDTTDAPTPSTSNQESPTPVLYSVGNTQPLNMLNYVNRKSTITSTTTSSYVRSPDSTDTSESPSSSTHAHIPQTVTSESCASSSCASEAAAATPVQPKPKKKKSKPSTSNSNPFNIKNTPKPSTQKPLEDEQTTQRILYILAEYKEQVENSPDKDKPAPRRRNNPAAPNGGSSKRKKSSSGSRRRDMSPVVGEESCRTMGSEDSSCATSPGGECNECLETHSPEESPRKVVRRLTFEQETHTHITQTRTIPQRNVIVTDGQAFAVRGAAGKPATTVLMPANYLLPVSMVKGGQQIAIVTNRGPKLLVGAGEGGAGGTLLFQRLIGPGGLKPVLTRPGVRHIRLPTAALQNLQAFNIASPATTVQPPDSTASPAPAPTPPDLVDNRAMSSPWPDREAGDVKPERGNSSPEGSEPWNLPSSSIADDYGYEEIVRTDNMDRTVLDAIPDRYSPDMEAQRIFDKMFDSDSKKSMYDSRCGYDIDASDDDKAYHQVVQRKDGRHTTRLTHVSAAALRHKYAILEHELRLQKSLSEECEDLGVDSPSASELFPEAELLFAPSPAHEQTIDQCHTPQPSILQGIPQPDLDDQIATDHLLTHKDRHDELDINLEDVGEIVTVGEDGMTTIPLDHEEFARSHEEFARSHPNTTFHSEPEDGEIPPFTIAQGVKGRPVSYHPRVVMAPQTTVISQATVEAAGTQNTVKFTDIDNMINAMPSPQHPQNANPPSVLVKDEGLTKFDRLLNESRELHLSNTASAIVHSTGNGTQVIRRVHYETRRDARYLHEDRDTMIAGDAKMTSQNRRDMQTDDTSSSERHSELFWESTPARPERRRYEFSSDSDKCCKSPYDETNSDSSGIGVHTRLDSVIKAARTERRRSDGSSTDDSHPPLRTYPAKRSHQVHSHHHSELDRSVTGKTRANERCHDVKDESRRRASNRGVVKRGCHCCNGSTAPPKPKKSRPKKSNDYHSHN